MVMQMCPNELLANQIQIQIQIQYALFIKVQSGSYHLRPRTNIHKLTIWGIRGTTRDSIYSILESVLPSHSE